jgi:hypothetical protein
VLLPSPLSPKRRQRNQSQRWYNKRPFLDVVGGHVVGIALFPRK